MPQYPWYEIVPANDKFQQGDFVEDCPVVVPKSIPRDMGQNIDSDILTCNVILMSQSCDMENRNIKFVLACPVSAPTVGKNALVEMQKGRSYAAHLLNKCDLDTAPTFARNLQVVDFRNVYSIEFDFLSAFTKDKRRLRLLPPYREHLSQAFARFFMRVGLPSGIPLN